MPDSSIPDPYYERYAAYYYGCLRRIQEILKNVGNVAALGSMERSAVCREALAQIAFIAESTPTTADLRGTQLE